MEEGVYPLTKLGLVFSGQAGIGDNSLQSRKERLGRDVQTWLHLVNKKQEIQRHWKSYNSDSVEDESAKWVTVSLQYICGETWWEEIWGRICGVKDWIVEVVTKDRVTEHGQVSAPICWVCNLMVWENMCRRLLDCWVLLKSSAA